jgi:hypothetical protein
VSGGPRTDPVQMVRIVKKRSALGATSPRAAKRPKRPQSRQSTGTGPEIAEQNLSGKYCTGIVPVPSINNTFRYLLFIVYVFLYSAL